MTPAVWCVVAAAWLGFVLWYGGFDKPPTEPELSAAERSWVAQRYEGETNAMLLASMMLSSGHGGEILVLEFIRLKKSTDRAEYNDTKTPDSWRSSPPRLGYSNTAGEAYQKYMSLRSRQHNNPIHSGHLVAEVPFLGTIHDTRVGPARSVITWSTGFRPTVDWSTVRLHRHKSLRALVNLLDSPEVIELLRHQFAACEEYHSIVVDGRVLSNLFRLLMLLAVIGAGLAAEVVLSACLRAAAKKAGSNDAHKAALGELCETVASQRAEIEALKQQLLNHQHWTDSRTGATTTCSNKSLCNSGESECPWGTMNGPLTVD